MAATAGYPLPDLSTSRGFAVLMGDDLDDMSAADAIAELAIVRDHLDHADDAVLDVILWDAAPDAVAVRGWLTNRAQDLEAIAGAPPMTGGDE